MAQIQQPIHLRQMDTQSARQRRFKRLQRIRSGVFLIFPNTCRVAARAEIRLMHRILR